MPNEFKTSPDATVLFVSTLGATVVLVGIALLVYGGWRASHPAVRLLCVVGTMTSFAVLAGAYLFVPLGYHINAKDLVVSRLGPDLVIPLRSIEKVTEFETSIPKSLRVMGSGGLFGYFGRFHNGDLGSYRAYGRRARPTVLLDTTDGRIVLTPDSPDLFVQKLGEAIPQSSAERSSGNTHT